MKQVINAALPLPIKTNQSSKIVFYIFHSFSSHVEDWTIAVLRSNSYERWYALRSTGNVPDRLHPGAVNPDISDNWSIAWHA